MNIDKCKKLVQVVDAQEKISDEWDQALEIDMSEETEIEFDRAYKAYWDAVNELAAFLVENVPGLDEKTAKRMALHKREEIKALVERAR